MNKVNEAREARMDEKVYCTFCGRRNDEVEGIIKGECAAICFACVVICVDHICNREKHLQAKQAQIDELMLEHCPDEMTKEQLETWGANQKAVDK